MKMSRSIVLTCLVGLLPTAVVGQTIVWTDANARRIQGKDVNGGEVQTVVQFQFPQNVYQIQYEPVAAKLYYRFYGPPTTFQRSNLDGTEPENIPTPSIGNFTLDVESRQLYWISEDSPDVLSHSGLDGSEVQSHTYPTCCLLTLEAIADDLFFGAGVGMSKGIWRADADGSNEEYLHVSEQPMDLSYDPVDNDLYLATTEAIYRMNPEGTGFQVIVREGAEQIVVDSRGRKLYWHAHPNLRLIRRSNLDGSNVDDFVVAADAGNTNLDIRGLTIVDPEPVTGACCDRDPLIPCGDDAILAECECAGCAWHPYQTCAEIECSVYPIPTTSAWGLTAMSLSLMIGAKVIFGHEARNGEGGSMTV